MQTITECLEYFGLAGDQILVVYGDICYGRLLEKPLSLNIYIDITKIWLMYKIILIDIIKVICI